MSPVRPNTGSSNFVFSSLTDVQEYFAHQRQKAQERADAYKRSGVGGVGGRMGKHERERIIAEAQAEARVYDDCWEMIGCIDVEFAYRNAGRVPESICLVCGEEQPARPNYCTYEELSAEGTTDGACDQPATFHVIIDEEGDDLCGTEHDVCIQHLGHLLDGRSGVVTPLTTR